MKEDLGNWANPDICVQPGCLLQISGMNFDPDAFLNEVHLPAERIVFKGSLGLPDEARKKFESGDVKISPDLPEISENLSETLELAMRVFDQQNLGVTVSKAHEMPTQIEEAIEFLTEHLNDLKKIADYKEIEYSALQFTAESEAALEGHEDFPPKFYNLIKEIGLIGVLVGSANKKPI